MGISRALGLNVGKRLKLNLDKIELLLISGARFQSSRNLAILEVAKFPLKEQFLPDLAFLLDSHKADFLSAWWVN